MRKKKFCIIFLLLLCIDFFSSLWYTSTFNTPVIKQMVGFLLLIPVLKLSQSNKLVFGLGFKLVLLSFILSAISSNILYSQSFYVSLKATMGYIICIAIYFLSWRWRLDEKFIINTIIVLSVVFSIIEVIQQFTYPTYWFNGRPPSENTGLLEERMGMWRYYIFGIDYCVLAFFFLLQRVLEKRSTWNNLMLMIVCFIGIVCFVARKNIYAVLFVTLIGILFSMKRKSYGTVFVVVVLFLSALPFLMDLLVELNEQTASELGEGSEDFIRFIAANYFINEMNSSPLYYLFGAGIPGQSSLGTLISKLQEQYNYFQSDCGFVGYFSMFGIFGLFALGVFFYRIIKYHRYIDLYLILFIIFDIIISFFYFFGGFTRSFAAFTVCVYLMEVSIQRNKKKECLLDTQKRER